MGNVSLKVSTRILKLNANQIVLSNTAAILEFIKNSFDEDAEKVKIYFFVENNKIKKIDIYDDGLGFTKEGIHSFLKIGISNKIKNSYTASGARLKTGSNGTGLYSAIRLGNKLEIKSNKFKLEVDWKYINDKDKVIEDIPVEFSENKDNFKFKEFNTLISISELKNISKDDIEEIVKELNFITLDPTLNVEFAITEQEKLENEKIVKSQNIKERIENLLQNYENKNDYIRGHISIKYNSTDGKCKVFIKSYEEKFKEFSIENNDLNFEITNNNFKGIIEGRYLLIEASKLKKNASSETNEFIKNENKILNEFYYNEMLFLTPKHILGIDFTKKVLKTKSSLPFRNVFGYTSAYGTNLTFDLSRTTISDDNYGISIGYYAILDSIIKYISDIFLKNFIQNDQNKKIIENNIKNKKQELPYSNTINFQRQKTFLMKTEKIEETFINLIFELQLNDQNEYYDGLKQSLKELIAMLKNKQNGILFFNISYHSLVRVFIELAFLYKLHEFYKNNSKTFKEKIKPFFLDKKFGNFRSIKSLLSRLKYSDENELKKFKEEILNKMGINNLDRIIDEVKQINNHIHFPMNNMKENVANNLIEKFIGIIKN